MACGLAKALDEPVEANGTDWPAALGNEYVGIFGTTERAGPRPSVPLMYSVEHFPCTARPSPAYRCGIALMTAGIAPTAPASPAPLTPSGLVVEGTLEKAKGHP